MSIRNKLFIKDFIISIVLFILFGILRKIYCNLPDLVFAWTHNVFFMKYTDSIFNSATVILLLLYILNWMVFIRNTIFHSKIKKSLEKITFIMIFWFLCRCIKFFYTDENVLLSRYLWYFYYIGMLFIPLYGLHISLYIGHDENWKISKRYAVVYGFTILLFLGVITNEYHHLMFQFTPEDFLITGNYSYGFFYYCVAVWMITLTLAMIGIIYYKSRTLFSRKRLWMSLSIILFLIIYSLFYNYLRIEFNELTITYIWTYIVFLKSLIYSGFVPSNFMHSSIFDESNISTMILDDKNKIHYLSKNTEDISKQLIDQLNQNEFKLDERTAIKQSFIHGGSIVWLEDVSSMNIVISELQKLQNEIKEKNLLLQEEVRLKEKEEKVRTQTALYDSIQFELKDSINQLDSLLQEENPDLFLVCILGSYIKRKSNLIILNKNSNSIQPSEFDYCMKEILDVLKIKNISCSFTNTLVEVIPITVLKDLYDSIIEVLLIIYPSIESFNIQCIYERQYGIKMEIQTDIDLKEKIKENNYVLNQKGSLFYVTYLIEKEN